MCVCVATEAAMFVVFSVSCFLKRIFMGRQVKVKNKPALVVGGRSNRSNDDVWANTAGFTNSNAGLKTAENCCTKHETERGEKENIIYARALAKKLIVWET